MKKIKYKEEQIVGILKEVEAGITVTEICRKYGISDATYYNWEAKYGGDGCQRYQKTSATG